MAALFPQWSNTALKLAVLGVAMAAVAAVATPMIYVRTAYNTLLYAPPDQPEEFDHRHHVGDDGIECLYCHSEAETSRTAGVPATSVCMGCHDQIWSESALLEPVRRSYFTRRPIVWNRVYKLPDFVYFNHSVHVQRGIGCVNCHGRVDRMPRVYRVVSLSMSWCLDCHRDPARYIRSPGTADYSSMWGRAFEALEHDISATREVTALSTCSACHR